MVLVYLKSLHHPYYLPVKEFFLVQLVGFY